MANMQAHQLKFTYPGETVPALADFSGSFEAGKLHCIFGPNGSGKSTLLAMLSGEELPESGEVRLDGKNLSHFRRRELARKLAVLEQDVPGKLPFTVRDLVMLGRYPWKRPFQLADASDEAAVAAAIEAAGLGDSAAKRYCHLSGGEKQRAMLARMLAQQTEVLLLDEPTSRLDVTHHLAFFELARQLAHQGKCVIAVCHDLYTAPLFADTAWLLAGGRLIAAGQPAEVLTESHLAAAYGCGLQVTYRDAREVSIRLP